MVHPSSPSDHRLPSLSCCVLLLLLQASAVQACGHHGPISAIEASAQRHLRHKQQLRNAQSTAQHSLQGRLPERKLGDGVTDQGGSFAASLQNQQQHTNGSDKGVINPAPIRISIEFQQVAVTLDPQIQTNLVAITNAVVATLQNYLMVRNPVQGGLLAPPICYARSDDGSTCLQHYPTFTSVNTSGGKTTTTSPSGSSLGYCGLAKINPAHVLDPSSCDILDTSPESASACHSYTGSSTGEPVDMYLYVTAVQDATCNGGAAGWALPCLFDLSTNRPIMGSANMCPYALLSSDTDQMVSVMVHEFLHLLGFTSALFPLYIDPVTGNELPAGSVTRVVTTKSGSSTQVVSPRVAQEARNQFGCSDLVGAALEDEGGDGSANSHWEYTHYQGEVMVASTMFAASGEPPRFSRLTAALFEDSGWYVANWTAVGGPLQWAQNSGCTLPQQGCKKMALQQPLGIPGQQMFCDQTSAQSLGASLRYQCGSTLRSVGQCRNVTFSNGCGMVVARGGTPSCTSVQYQYSNADVFGWTNGPSSRCFPVTYKFAASDDGGASTYVFPSTGKQGDVDAICFPSTCTPDGKNMLLINGQQIRCQTGRTLDLSIVAPDVYRQGLVGPCPDEAVACASFNCSGKPCASPGGSCYGGRCICRLGWAGADCSLSLVSGNISASDGLNIVQPPPPSLPPGVSAPPPALKNTTTWYQVIQLTMTLSNTSLPAFTSQSPAFLTTLASWADVNITQASLLSATALSPTGQPTSSYIQDSSAAFPLQAAWPNAGDSGSTTTSTTTTTSSEDSGMTIVTRTIVSSTTAASGAVEGKGSGAAAPPPPLQQHRHSLLGLMQLVKQTFEQRQALVQASRDSASWFTAPRASRRLQGVSNLTQGLGPIQVIADLRMASTLQTTLITGRLLDSGQVAQLAQQLQAAGFNMVQGSLREQVLIVQQTSSTPVTTPAAVSQTNTASAMSSDTVDSARVLSWTIVIVALSVGGGVALLAGAVVCVACSRTSRLEAKEKERKIAALQQQQQQQQHHSSGGGWGSNYPSSGGASAAPFPPPGAVVVTATAATPKQSRFRSSAGGASPMPADVAPTRDVGPNGPLTPTGQQGQAGYPYTNHQGQVVHHHPQPYHHHQHLAYHSPSNPLYGGYASAPPMPGGGDYKQ